MNEQEHRSSTLPRVRVVIPCRNEAGYIGRCLRSLVEADRTGIEAEVWVCDGMSTDGTRNEIKAITDEHAWIRLVDNPAQTTPQAMNLGLKPEGSDVGIILGAHAEVTKSFLVENIALLRDHPKAGCVGGIIENVYLDAASRRIGSALAHPFGVGSAHFRTGRKEGEVDTVAFGAYRREVFEKVGFFDERLVRNQDDEFNYRVTQAGWSIRLSHRIRSKYYVRASLSRLFKQYKQYGYWKVYVNRLHGSVTTLRQLAPAALIGGLVVGSVLAFAGFWGQAVFLIGTAFYLAAALFSAIQAARSSKDVPGVFAAFIVIHAAYGIGYWQGIIDLILLRREPRSRSHTLTR